MIPTTMKLNCRNRRMGQGPCFWWADEYPETIILNRTRRQLKGLKTNATWHQIIDIQLRCVPSWAQVHREMTQVPLFFESLKKLNNLTAKPLITYSGIIYITMTDIPLPRYWPPISPGPHVPSHFPPFPKFRKKSWKNTSMQFWGRGRHTQRKP